MAGNVILGLAGLTILLLLVLAVLVLGLRRKLAELSTAGESRANRAAPVERDSTAFLEPLLQNIGNAIVQLHEQVSSFDVVFSGIQEQLAQISDGLKDLRAGRDQATAPAATPTPSPVSQSSHMVEPPRATPPTPSFAEPDAIPVVTPTTYAPPESAPEAQPFAAQLIEGAPTSGSTPSLINDYRQIISEPRKNEINRWVDERGGKSCTVSEDGTIFPLTRDAGGLLVVLRTADGTDLLVPGGRMVVEFATSFASPISMRSVTRDCFELSGDGTGILRLLEPARIKPLGEGWSLVSPGRLSGFTS